VIKNSHFFLLFLFFISLSLIFFSEEHFFFWDTVQLASEHANWFYSENLKTILLPNTLDSGHIPAFGYYLALIWVLFGKTLVVSHWAMLPFIWLLFFFSYKIAGIYSRTVRQQIALSFLFLIEPTLLAQLTLVSPDIWLSAFFMMHWWAIEKRKTNFRLISALFLVLSSLRGSIALFILELYFLIVNRKKWNTYLVKNHILPLLPAILVFIGYQILHFQHTQWIAWHKDSPWAESFEWASFKEIIYNSVIFIWRLIDFGRLIIWILILLFIWKLKKPVRTITIKRTAILLTISIITYYFVSVFHKGLMAHRYFIPIYLISLVLVFNFIIQLKKYFKLAYLLIVISLIAGQLLVYPDKIAKGWDASLAHWPYYQLREDALEFMMVQKIKKQDVGCDFPNLAIENEISLNGDTSQFKAYDLKTDSLIFYSNIFNNFTDEEIDSLQKWHPIFSEQQCGVKLIIYKK
jgi:hypothetical protein